MAGARLAFLVHPSWHEHGWIEAIHACTTKRFDAASCFARMDRRPHLVSIVVPTYNERQNLSRLVDAVAQHLALPYEIIVVDDSSPDGTADLARDLASKHPVRVLSRPEKSGLGSAYRDGFAAAKGDLVFEMDADLSHDPRYLSALVEAALDGADVVIGSRYVEGGRIVGWNWYRKLVSGVGNGLAKIVLALGVSDVTSGYRCYHRDAAALLQDVRSDGYAFQVEALWLARRHGLVVREVPITFENRTVGKSKLGASEFVAYLETLFRLRLTPKPRRGKPTRVS